MARISGVDLPNHKKISISLTSIYGIGYVTADKILKEAGIDGQRRTRELTDSDINNIRTIIDKSYSVEGDLRREIGMNIKVLVDLNCYRGIRHRLKLPVRGQRSKTNARTRKGPRKTVAGKKKAPGM